MEILKKLNEKVEDLGRSPFGIVYALNGFLWFMSWVLSWSSVRDFALGNADVMTLGFMAYGLIKLVIWFVKDIKSLIADEFKYQVRTVVREELKNLSRV